MQPFERVPLKIATRGRNVDAEGDLLLHPGQSVAFTYRHDGQAGRRHRFRMVGEVGTNWRERCEHEQPVIWYRSLEDALTREDTYNDELSLHLRGGGEDFARNAWHLIPGGELAKRPPAQYFSVGVRTRGLTIALDGFVGAALEIYHARPGRHPLDVFDPPDRVLELRAAPGTKRWTTLRAELAEPAEIACVLLRVGGVRFAGEVWFNTPRLGAVDGGGIVRPFNTPAPYFPRRNWLGENLSRKEWPEFRVTVNGKPVFRGTRFWCITRDPDGEFLIPESALRPGANRLELTLEADYPSAPCFVLRRAEVLREAARAFEVVAVPEYARTSAPAPVLVEINRAGTALQMSDGQTRSFPQPGLAVLTFDAESLAAGIAISDGRRTETVQAKRAVSKDDDGVRLGTGDAVYIPQTPEAFTRFLKWYAAERIGNFMTFRPAYRWSGPRTVDPAAWNTVRPLLNELGMEYALMVDGRELSGMNANPPDALLAGPGYRGRQAHENDGAFNYWGADGPWKNQDPLFYYLFQRGNDPGGIIPHVRPGFDGNEFHPHFSAQAATDMKAGAEQFLANLRLVSPFSPRHTGPSALFRYFYQAGLTHLGAEQMYCAEDVILAALRGASRAYRQADFGAHLAVQWSSVPLAEPEHYRRYFLSLACCYLQGVSQINTEEGLYRMEQGSAREDRFGAASTGHREWHAKFRRFMETHQRRGRLRTSLGILQGRYCGWTGFCRIPAWNQRDPSMCFGPPEESFDLLKLFYPRCQIDTIYRLPCPHEPQGWYSGTPYGPVDLVPVEAPADVLETYSALAFLGWNTFDENEFERLLAFVRRGGTLLLGRPHASANVRRGGSAVLPESAALHALLGPALRSRTRTERKVGRGRVIFYGQDAYPAESAIRAAYEADLRRLAETVVAAERSRGWIAGTEDVDFTVYDHGALRTAYLLNIAWWRPPGPARARLLLGEHSHAVPVPFGRIGVLTLADGWGIYPAGDGVDILAARATARGLEFTFQADGPSRFRLYHAGGMKTLTAPPGTVTVKAPR